MSSTSKKCISWVIGLYVVGAFVMAFGPDIIQLASDSFGITKPFASYLISFVTSTVRLAAFPVGAALIGAVVVIETLMPRLARLEATASNQESATQ